MDATLFNYTKRKYVHLFFKNFFKSRKRILFRVFFGNYFKTKGIFKKEKCKDFLPNNLAV